MKDKLLLSLFALLTTTMAWADVEINKTNFPDANFRNYLLRWLDGADGVFTASEIANVTSMNLPDICIENLQGIEYFTALKTLNFTGNQVRALDVSKNTKLEKLYCGNNQLTALDVSHNTALTELYCYRNKRTALDLSQNANMKEVWCYQNQIKGKVIYNENEGNVMTVDQVAAAKAKGWIPRYYDGNSWQEYAGSEPVNNDIAINETTFPDENFRNWVLSQSYGADSVLTDEELADIKIVNVQDKGIKDLKGIENFKALTWLMCGKNQMTTLDVSNNTELEYLWCFGNQLTELNVSENTSLTGIWCGVNQLTSLDVSKNTELTRLDCSQNQLTELDVTKNAALEKLFCSDNQFTTLDVSQCPELTLLWCNNNKLSALNVMGCAALTDIFCYKNQITDTDMDVLVEGLPIVDSGKIYVVCGVDEQNDLTTIQVAAAKAKGWTPICLDMSDGWVEYSDDAPGYYPGIGNCREYLGSEPNPDGIVSLFGETEDGAIIYELSGHRLSRMQRGVNIVNGRKILK